MAEALSICILTRVASGHGSLGGAERQCVLLAEGLVRRGHRVTIVGREPGGETCITPSGIEVSANPADLTDLLRRQSADVVYIRDIGWVAEGVGAAKATGASSVVAFYSLPQCGGWDGRLLAYAVRSGSPRAVRRRLRDAVLEREMRAYATRADARVAQTREQLELLAGNGVPDAVVLPNIQPQITQDGSQRDVVSWVGKSFKRPELFLDLAERFSEAAVRFVIACRLSTDSARDRRTLARIARLRNVDHLPDAGEEQLRALYARSIALVNTSVVEGFPNTFLEAWACGTPVLSLGVDPDGTIETERLGFACRGSMQHLGDALSDLFGDTSLVETQGRNALAYLRRVHDPEVLLPAYETLFASVASGGASGGPRS